MSAHDNSAHNSNRCADGNNPLRVKQTAEDRDREFVENFPGEIVSNTDYDAHGMDSEDRKAHAPITVTVLILLMVVLFAFMWYAIARSVDEGYYHDGKATEVSSLRLSEEVEPDVTVMAPQKEGTTYIPNEPVLS